MNNFDIFDKAALAKVIEPFLPEAIPHITPIAYRAYTPDIFMFLFRTSGKGGKEYYFVAFQYDYIADDQAIVDDIKDFVGVVPLEAMRISGETEDHYIFGENETYKTRLFRIERPVGLGYWSENILVGRSDNIDEKLKDFSEKQRKAVGEILEHDSEAHSITVYKNGTKMELFYDK
ncbi:MAG: hypothetical protein ABIP74_01720 [Candidatus Saccharimonas sp.]